MSLEEVELTMAQEINSSPYLMSVKMECVLKLRMTGATRVKGNEEGGRHEEGGACQDEQFGIMLVGERWEWDRAEFPALQPMHSGGVNGNSLLRCHIRAVLQVIVLPLLFSFQVQPREPANTTSNSSSLPNRLSIRLTKYPDNLHQVSKS